MAKLKPDYSHWFRVWNELSRSTGMTLKSFCDREGLDPECTRKAFERRRKAKGKRGRSPRKDAGAKWESLRLEFLEGEWKTLRDFARDKGLNGSSGHFARQTRGWLDERAKIREQSRAETTAAIADHKGAEAIAKLHSRVLTALYTCLSDLESNGLKRATIGKKIETSKESLELMRNVSVVVDSLLKLQPAVSRMEGMVGARDVIKKLAEQDIDVTRAALAFEEMGISLPETIRILLSKEMPPEPPEPSNPIPSDEELDKLWRDGLERIAEQERTFLPERQREIEALKLECKALDSFAEDALDEPKRKDVKNV